MKWLYSFAAAVLCLAFAFFSSCNSTPGGGGGGGGNSSSSITPTPFNPNAPAITRDLARGINVGNELDAYPGSESSWTGLLIQESWFDDYTNAGFNSVRIPVTWGYELTGNEGNPPMTGKSYTINAAYLARVKQVVDWALSRNLYVVLNCHHEFWLYSNYSGQIATFESIWSQIASAFAGESGNLVFEILNEPQAPMTNAEVNDMNMNVLAIIRASNPTRFVMVGADSYNAFNSLTSSAFILPSDPYLIANFHYYNPYGFCGNGAGTWGNSSDSNTMSNDFISVSNWAALKNVPVFLGEYGACNGCDTASRLRWYGAISRFANNDAFAYDCWDDDGTLSTSFLIFYRAQGTFNTSVLNAIFTGN